MSRRYYVYILTNHTNAVLYTGVTRSIRWRIKQHRECTGSKFTARYNVTKLVYVEDYATPREAILREKQIKAGSRARKLALINSINPEWKDLYDEVCLLS